MLAEAIVLLDSEIKQKEYGADTGATACIVLVTETDIYCANAGDSRAVLSSNNEAIPLSEDHKP